MAIRTPQLRLNVPDAPAEIWLKLETLQPIGSFKHRHSHRHSLLLMRGSRIGSRMACRVELYFADSLTDSESDFPLEGRG